MKYSNDDLKEMQSWPLQQKIQTTQTRVIEWYQHWDNAVYVSFSGGKDSTALADITARVCKAINAKLILLFCDTGLEYSQIRSFVDFFANWLKEKYEIEVELYKERPQKWDNKKKSFSPYSFRDIVLDYGYPVISKDQAKYIHEIRTTKSEKLRNIRLNGNKHGLGKVAEKWKFLIDAPFKISDECCKFMKKKPAIRFEKKHGVYPIIGTTAEESQQRKITWMEYGCNGFEKTRPTSVPLSFWTSQDILSYLKLNRVPIAEVYGDIVETGGGLCTTGVDRTGCVFCGFGAMSQESAEKFIKLKEIDPKKYEYCMKPVEEGGLGLKAVLDYIGVKY